jgi:hypothetical protein
VPWSVVSGVRSMARAAVALGQPVIRTVALGAGCFHGTNCFTNTKKLQGKSVYRGRGPFFLPEVKKCFTQHIPCETGLKPAPPATRPVFWGPWVVGTHLRAGAHEPRDTNRETRATGQGARSKEQGARSKAREPRTANREPRDTHKAP